MSGPRVLPRLLMFVVVVSLPLTLLAASLRITTGHWLLRWEYGKADFPPDPYGFTTAERLRLAGACVDYLVTDAGIERLADLEAEGRPAFNERELQHMVDVKRALWGLLWAGLAAGALVVGGTVGLAIRPATRARAPASLLRGSLLTAGLLIAVGGLMLLRWDTFFVAFHQVFFAEGTWTFPYSDTLIRLFPVRFWMDVGWVIVGLLAGSTTLLTVGSFLWYRRAVRRP